jgi:uncharacterized protein
MTRIGILSDTHGFVDQKILEFFKEVDEVWHAGDIGNIETADKLSAFKPLKAVYGNIDGKEIRSVYKENLRFNCEDVEVFITHIGGYPGKYGSSIKTEIVRNPPKLFICGHSHILKVMFDKKLQCLHINPGAAGINGFHHFRTAIRLIINKNEIKDLEILEIPRN